MALRSSTVASIVSTLMSGFNALTVRAAPSTFDRFNPSIVWMIWR